MNTRKLIIILLLLTAAYCFNSGCRKDENNPVQPPLTKPDTLSLSVTDQTNTSITLRVELKGSSGTWRFYLTRLLNGMEEKTDTFTVFGRDTLIYDNNRDAGLLPDTSYTYRVKTHKNDTASVSTRTLGYTSHEYEWREYCFGENFSGFYKIWGTSADNVYACGVVYILRDGKTVTRGVWHWDGSSWNMVDTDYAGGYAIHGFNDHDIWTSGANMHYYDGVKWVPKGFKLEKGLFFILDPVFYTSGDKSAVWGTSSSNLYVGTYSGQLLHWNGTRAQKVKNDIKGTISSIHGTGPDDIYLTTNDMPDPGRRVSELYHYDGKTWSVLARGKRPTEFMFEMHAPFSSVWAYNKDIVYMAGDKVYYKTKKGWGGYSFTYQTMCIRGTKPNDIFNCGNYGNAAHFNGKNWRIYELNPEVILCGIYMTGNDVFIVGMANMGQAYIYHGRRK